MAEPFRRQAASHGLFARLSGRTGKASVVREMEELLARAARVRDVPIATLREVAVRGGVDFGRYRSARCAFYRRFLEHCLVDRSVSPEESADLDHLRGMLQLDDVDLARIHEDVVQGVYGGALDEVLKDQRLDPEEEEFLRRLGTALEIPSAMAERLYQEAEGRARRRFLSRSVVREDSFLVGRHFVLELSGSSQHGFEDAVRQALDEAVRAYPGIARAEVCELVAELEAGQVARWRVKLKASRTPQE